MIDFRSPALLLGHVRKTMAFYDGRCLDPSGGFFHFFKDDGTVYDRRTRHLVSSTRFVFNHAMAHRWLARPGDQDAVRHGLRFLEQAHRQPQGGYAWQLDWDGQRASVTDGTNHCYGLAFVLLAYAHAVMAGVVEAREGLAATFDLMERHFGSPRTACTPTRRRPAGRSAPIAARTPTCTLAKRCSRRTTRLAMAGI